MTKTIQSNLRADELLSRFSSGFDEDMVHNLEKFEGRVYIEPDFVWSTNGCILYANRTSYHVFKALAALSGGGRVLTKEGEGYVVSGEDYCPDLTGILPTLQGCEVYRGLSLPKYTRKAVSILPKREIKIVDSKVRWVKPGEDSKEAHLDARYLNMMSDMGLIDMYVQPLPHTPITFLPAGSESIETAAWFILLMPLSNKNRR